MTKEWYEIPRRAKALCLNDTHKVSCFQAVSEWNLNIVIPKFKKVDFS